jgi:hypothetical protein
LLLQFGVLGLAGLEDRTNHAKTQRFTSRRWRARNMVNVIQSEGLLWPPDPWREWPVLTNTVDSNGRVVCGRDQQLCCSLI